MYVARTHFQSLIYSGILYYVMSCESCGHPRMAHKETTLSVYFCNQCNQIESHVTFVIDRKVEKSDMSEDLLGDLYWNCKAFRRSVPI